jgi:serine/threonine-protein kinase
MTDGSSPSPNRDLTGQILIGRYEVLEKIGKGAMGEVYRAMHTMIKKPVAIKVLHPAMSQREDIITRFQREAQAAAHIDHPNICAATDFGKGADGSFFLVMEFLDGAPLKDRLEQAGVFTPERAASIVAQISSALSSARALGIVHRDLKPDNVFLIKKGQTTDFVKIVDFGIARVYLDDEEGTKLTAAGEIFGTPQYMAPEQAEGGVPPLLLVFEARADLRGARRGFRP